MATEGIGGPFNPGISGSHTKDTVSTRKVSNDRGSEKPAIDRAPSGDRVTITSAASQLKQIADAVEQTPDVDSKRVEAARRSISNGDFEINAGRIAEKMIALDTALHRSSQR